MGVKVVERSYKDRFNNDTTDWLLANTGDWQTAIFTVDASVDFNASSQQPIQIDNLNRAFVTPNGEDWGAFGFDIGDKITFQYVLQSDTTGNGEFDTSVQVTQDLKVKNVAANRLEVDDVINANDFTQMPQNTGRRNVTQVKLFVSSAPEGVRMEYTHLTNNNSTASSLRSFIDNSITEYIAPRLSDGGSWVNMIPAGKQSGMSIKSVRVRKLLSNGGGSESYGTANLKPIKTSVYKLTGAGWYNRETRAIPMDVIGTKADYFKTVEHPYRLHRKRSNGDLQRGIKDACFIRDLTASATHEISINLSLVITNTYDIGFTGDLDLILIKYKGGDALNTVSSTTLTTWTDTANKKGQTLTYNDKTSLSMLAGESYCIAIYYRSSIPMGVMDSNLVEYKIKEGVVQLSDPGGDLSGTSNNRYQFEINYMLSSFFETFKDIENRQIPPFLLNEGSLTDNIRFKFLPKWNNPNVLIQNNLTDTVRKGNTGWFNENFNQLDNNFKVEKVEYRDELTNIVNSIDYAQDTYFEVRVSGVKNLNRGTLSGIGFAWIPTNEEDYVNKNTPFYRNLFVQSGDTSKGFPLNTRDAGPYTGAGIQGGKMNLKDVSVTNERGILVIKGVFTPNAKFTEIMEAKDTTDRNCVFYVSVANIDLKRNYSDRVTLICDYGEMIKTIQPAGDYPYIQASFLNHSENKSSLGSRLLNSLVHDDVLVRLPFRVKKDANELFQSIVFGVEMVNEGTGENFELEAYNVDVSNSPKDSNGVQQFSVSETRGFLLPTGNNKNIVEIEKSEDTLDFSSYTAYYAFRIRWEDWQKNENAIDEFFNSDLLNNGLNNDWFTYLGKLGWEIKFFTKINTISNGDLVQYKNSWKFNIKDYDSNQNVRTEHQYIRHSDDSLLNVGTDPDTGKPLGVILTNEETRIEVDFTILDNGVFDITSHYGIITIEIDKGAGQFEMRELTTVWDREAQNPLKGLTGERLTMEVSADNKTITVKCLVDPVLLEQGARYRVTGRLGCLSDGATFETGLYESLYENLYE
ncbi:MAG: hypothetical protein ACPGRW_06315 [Flavobacteriaceae bacterium]